MPVPAAGSTDGPLLQAGDLADFAGAPFTDSVVLAVGESIRSAAGWRIAPSTNETARIRPRGHRLFLRTLYLTAVAAIRDVSDPDNTIEEDLADWDWSPSGVLERCTWRRLTGRVYEVDYTHGYASCPQDLLEAAAALAQNAKVNKATGGVRLGSLSINGTGAPGVDAPGGSVETKIGRYRIPGSR